MIFLLKRYRRKWEPMNYLKKVFPSLYLQKLYFLALPPCQKINSSWHNHSIFSTLQYNKSYNTLSNMWTTISHSSSTKYETTRYFFRYLPNRKHVVFKTPMKDNYFKVKLLNNLVHKDFNHTTFLLK